MVASLEVMLRDFDPLALDGSAATRLLLVFTQAEHLCAAAKGLAAQRVDETGAWRASGERSAADYVALKTGVNVGAAVKMLETLQQLDALPATSDAFRAGKLSAAQAHEITGAASKNPAAEQELLDAARRSKLKGLKDRCRVVRAGAEEDDAAWAKRLRDKRSLRMWTDSDGAPSGMWRMAPDRGGELKAALEAETDLLFREARGEARRESRDAYAADALYHLITRGPRKATAASLVVDESAVRRGFVKPGERCEITGVGPVPVAVAATMLADAKVREITRDGAELPEYSSEKRYYPPWLTAWLDAKYPVCGVAGCDSDFRLQYDHVVGLEQGGRTERDNLWRLCPHHHRLKTNAGWRVTGSTHQWDLAPPSPDDPDPP